MRTTVSGTHHEMRWSPESGLGTWAITFATVSLGGLLLLALGFALGVVETAESFTDNWLLTGVGAVLLLSGVAAMVAGVAAVLRHHDRSWAVLLAAAFGLVAAAVLVREIAQGF